jgi:hypothetical protein
MRALSVRMGVVLVVCIGFGLVACGGSSAPTDAPTAPPATEAPAPTAAPAASATPQPTQTSAEEEAAPIPTEAVEETAPSAGGSGDVPEIPFDIPIMEGATDLVVQEGVGSVSYVMQNTEIEQVVDFYTSEMEALGWESKTASNVGMMATLVFETDTARVSASLQANQIAKTVNVRLFILTK